MATSAMPSVDRWEFIARSALGSGSMVPITISTISWQYPAQQRQFHILDHLQVRRKTGRNWITRCPSCAAAGRDKSGDNLAISVDEPQKYICWAGCSKEMIRAALGCPIPEKRESAYAVG